MPWLVIQAVDKCPCFFNVIVGIFIGLSFVKYQTEVDALLIDAIIVFLLAAGIVTAFIVSLKNFNRERIAGN
jgi:hypothetical protein